MTIIENDCETFNCIGAGIYINNDLYDSFVNILIRDIEFKDNLAIISGGMVINNIKNVNSFVIKNILF